MDRGDRRTAAREIGGVTGTAEDWSVISPDLAEARAVKFHHWRPDRLTPEEGLVADQEVLGEILDRWLGLYDVRLRVDWYRTPKPDCRLSATNVMGAVAANLVLAIARVDGFIICSACGRPYAPQRQPRANQRNYCSDDRCQKAKTSYASRNHKRKKAATS
jgi:hypothetical protein